eukprot:NODE_1159_length_1970_cov_0.708177.p2 type:complete len:162 gc:universal NODE_1159_length_1970_cov_0.708177:2-487(+)
MHQILLQQNRTIPKEAHPCQLLHTLLKELLLQHLLHCQQRQRRHPHITKTPRQNQLHLQHTRKTNQQKQKRPHHQHTKRRNRQKQKQHLTRKVMHINPINRNQITVLHPLQLHKVQMGLNLSKVLLLHNLHKDLQMYLRHLQVISISKLSIYKNTACLKCF